MVFYLSAAAGGVGEKRQDLVVTEGNLKTVKMEANVKRDRETSDLTPAHFGHVSRRRPQVKERKVFGILVFYILRRQVGDGEIEKYLLLTDTNTTNAFFFCYSLSIFCAQLNHRLITLLNSRG